MRQIILLCFILASWVGLSAQTPEWQWARRAGGAHAITGERDIGQSVSCDTDGNIYVTGMFYGTADFGSTTLTCPSGWPDIYVAKLDANGNWLWARQAGGTGDDYGCGIKTDSNGNSYVTGYFKSSATFGSLTLSTYSYFADIFVAKLDTNGNWLWARQTDNTGDIYSYGIAIDSGCNSYVTGIFEGTASFGSTTLTSSDDFDIFAAKLDANGNWLWANGAGGASGYDYGFAVCADGFGNCYLTGYFWDTASFGSLTVTGAGGNDAFVAKLDPGGNWLWVRSAGSIYNNDSGYGISTDSDGYCYVTGIFEGTVSFGSTSLISYNIDVFVAKLDDSGNWLWAVQGGGYNEDWATGIFTDRNGNSYVSGYFRLSAFFGTATINNSGWDDIFTAKLDTNGNWLWAIGAGGADFDKGYGICADDAGNAIVSGCFQSAALFGADSLVCSGTDDIFIAKLAVSAPPGLPLPPQNLSIAWYGNDILLNWDPVTQDTGGQPLTPDHYNVYWAGYIGGPYTCVQTTATFWIHTGAILQPPKLYYVTAVSE